MKFFKSVKPARLISSVVLFAALFTSGPSHAEFFGMLSGRSADLSSMPDVSVEGGYLNGKLVELDYTSFGSRLNYRVSPEMMVHFDGAQVELGVADGNAFGFGVFYQLKDILESSDVTLKASYHSVKVENDRGEEGEGKIMAIQALFSGKASSSSELSWYANIGMHRMELEDDGEKENEVGFGGGLIMPTSFGEAFAGVDVIDETVFGIGFRYFLQ